MFDRDYGYHEPDYGDLHDGCVPIDEALQHVIENEWPDVEATVDSVRGHDWVVQSRPCLEVLSKISEVDRVHSQGALKKCLPNVSESIDQVGEELLFAVATDVSRLIERLGTSEYVCSPNEYPEIQLRFEPTVLRSLLASSQCCTLDGDISWAKDALLVSRAFIEFLSAVSDGDLQGASVSSRIRQPIQVLNNYGSGSGGALLVYWEAPNREVKFGKISDPRSPNLASFLATWITEYITLHYPQVGLGVCVECGTFFERERRDKAFCSKTCQNRVAYKRKRLLESDALALASVSSEEVSDIEPGLWVHHPRFGIGLIESVGTNDGSSLKPTVLDLNPDPNFQARIKSMLSRKVRARVRFLHGLRVLTYLDLFEGQKREDQLPTFYRVNSRETLEKLL